MQNSDRTCVVLEAMQPKLLQLHCSKSHLSFRNKNTCGNLRIAFLSCSQPQVPRMPKLSWHWDVPAFSFSFSQSIMKITPVAPVTKQVAKSKLTFHFVLLFAAVRTTARYSTLRVESYCSPVTNKLF